MRVIPRLPAGSGGSGGSTYVPPDLLRTYKYVPSASGTLLLNPEVYSSYDVEIVGDITFDWDTYALPNDRDITFFLNLRNAGSHLVVFNFSFLVPEGTMFSLSTNEDLLGFYKRPGYEWVLMPMALNYSVVT